MDQIGRHFGKLRVGPPHCRPRAVLFDSWNASLANLKQVRGLGWTYLTR